MANVRKAIAATCLCITVWNICLCEIMKSAALPECQVPFKCDPTIETVWYESDYFNGVKEYYDGLLQKMSKDEALSQIYEKYCECEPSRIDNYL